MAEDRDLHALMLADLEALRGEYEAGDSKALMSAIREAFVWNLDVPQWAKDAFVRHTDDVLQERKRSWDDAFGKARTRGHLKPGRLQEELLCYWTGCRLLIEDADLSVDDGLFEAIAEELDIAPSYAKRRYYEGKKKYEPYLNR